MIICFDIGASSGLVSLGWLKNHNDIKIFAFEPNKNNYKKLINNTSHISNIISYNTAISSINGKKTFYVASHPNSSSLLPFSEANKWKSPFNDQKIMHTVDKYPVECIRLEDFITKNNIDVIDFLKIDTQGHDLDVIKSLGKKIEIVKEIVAEVQIVDFELYKNGAKKDDMVSYMLSCGFEIYKTQKWTLNQEENIYFVNKRFSNFLHLDI